MKKRPYFTIITTLGMSFLLWQCENEPPDLKRKEQIADGYCECASAIASLDARAKMIADSSGALTTLLDSMQIAFDQATACLLPLRTSIGPLKPDELPEIQRILQRKCPNLAANKELMTDLLCR